MQYLNNKFRIIGCYGRLSAHVQMCSFLKYSLYHERHFARRNQFLSFIELTDPPYLPMSALKKLLIVQNKWSAKFIQTQTFIMIKITINVSLPQLTAFRFFLKNLYQDLTGTTKILPTLNKAIKWNDTNYILELYKSFRK